MTPAVPEIVAWIPFAKRIPEPGRYISKPSSPNKYVAMVVPLAPPVLKIIEPLAELPLPCIEVNYEYDKEIETNIKLNKYFYIF